jgi:hypothetical protein
VALDRKLLNAWNSSFGSPHRRNGHEFETPMFVSYSGRVVKLFGRAGDDVVRCDPLFATHGSELPHAEYDLITASSNLTTTRAQLALAQTLSGCRPTWEAPAQPARTIMLKLGGQFCVSPGSPVRTSCDSTACSLLPRLSMRRVPRDGRNLGMACQTPAQRRMGYITIIYYL